MGALRTRKTNAVSVHSEYAHCDVLLDRQQMVRHEAILRQPPLPILDHPKIRNPFVKQLLEFT